MFESPLALFPRSMKPRIEGLTVLIDPGLPTAFFADVVQSHGHLIDAIKLGWGTALVTRELDRKIALCHEHDIHIFFGGTFFEKALSQGRLSEYSLYCERHGVRLLEISNGTIDLAPEEKAALIREFKGRFEIVSEVGVKDQERSEQMTAGDWIDQILSDLEAGATRVILEARESGTSGICGRDGQVKSDIEEAIQTAGIDPSRLIFEAPLRVQQVHWLKAIGAEVNLGNVSFNDVVSLETMRLGLRTETFALHG